METFFFRSCLARRRKWFANVGKKNFCDTREIKLTVFCVVSSTEEFFFFFVYVPCNIMTNILILSSSKPYLSTYNSHYSYAVIFLQMFIWGRWLNFNSNLFDINTLCECANSRSPLFSWRIPVFSNLYFHSNSL